MLADDVYLDALADDAAALAGDVLPDLDAPVPTCPGWTVADLLGHLGGIHRWATALVTAPSDVRVRRRDTPPPPEGPAVVDWCAESVAGSVTALRGVDLDGSAMTWDGPHPRRWWLRRLTHETAVHRVDLRGALGVGGAAPPAPEGDLAVDAVDEWLEVFLPARLTVEDLARSEGSIHLHRTDGDGDRTTSGEWLLTVAGGTLTVTRTHAKGDVAARGPAATIALVVWRRAPIDDLEVFGDRDLLERLLDAARF